MFRRSDRTSPGARHEIHHHGAEDKGITRCRAWLHLLRGFGPKQSHRQARLEVEEAVGTDRNSGARHPSLLERPRHRESVGHRPANLRILAEFGIKTALDFARRPEEWVR